MFNRILAELTAKRSKPEQLMIDATHLKAHRTAASLLKKGCSPTYRTQQRRVKLQAACCLRWSRPTADPDSKRRADERLQRCRADASRLPKAKSLLADKGPRIEETFRRHAFWAVNEHIDGRRARMDNLPTHTQAQTPRLDESMMVSVRRKHFSGVERWNLKAALHLIGHDAVDYFRIALCVDEELADNAVPRPDVGK